MHDNRTVENAGLHEGCQYAILADHISEGCHHDEQGTGRHRDSDLMRQKDDDLVDAVHLIEKVDTANEDLSKILERIIRGAYHDLTTFSYKNRLDLKNSQKCALKVWDQPK